MKKIFLPLILLAVFMLLAGNCFACDSACCQKTESNKKHYLEFPTDKTGSTRYNDHDLYIHCDAVDWNDKSDNPRIIGVWRVATKEEFEDYKRVKGIK